MPGGYVVRDANGQALAYVYSRDNEAEARQANSRWTRVADRPLQDDHPALSKAAQQERALLSDGVDDVADLLVVEQEIDELRDLDAVDADNRLPGRASGAVPPLQLARAVTGYVSTTVDILYPSCVNQRQCVSKGSCG
jgi:hypothetical protein